MCYPGPHGISSNSTCWLSYWPFPLAMCPSHLLLEAPFFHFCSFQSRNLGIILDASFTPFINFTSNLRDSPFKALPISNNAHFFSFHPALATTLWCIGFFKSYSDFHCPISSSAAGAPARTQDHITVPLVPPCLELKPGFFLEAGSHLLSVHPQLTLFPIPTLLESVECPTPPPAYFFMHNQPRQQVHWRWRFLPSLLNSCMCLELSVTMQTLDVQLLNKWYQQIRIPCLNIQESQFKRGKN